VVKISNSPDLQVVTLDSGEQLTCRIVVLACGLNGDLLHGLHMKRTWIQRAQSAAVGFSLAPTNGRPFPFDAVTYSLMTPRTGIDYISLFPMDQALRANLFAFPSAGSLWMHRLLRDPDRELPRLLPKLSHAIGDYRLIGKMEASLIHLYRTEGDPPDGIVLIGDAAQNSCPSTGTGLTKIFTDVEILAELMPHWLESAGMSKEKLHSFVADPRKVAADAAAIRSAYYRRHACSERSLKWKVHRLRLHLTRQLKNV
jgi:2-polyprenyl-6-methoxyphenol hydroxylase-like FAD-dependent oxidoreductase